MSSLPKNTENISISLPSWLLEELDEYIEKNDFTRSNLIAKVIRQYLWRKKEDLEHWEAEYNKSHGL